ncbi:MAG: DUF3795 domain-containing protein [Chloroflexi bacterium]|jgi:hypothetical protein|nr:DUF3795 domain-containing protein [Chloroflexota bacterium]
MSNPDTNLVATCGLYRGDCHGYTGAIADLARDLRKELRHYKYDKFAKAIPFKAFKNYDECYETLGAMVKFRCKKACHGGGGPPFCKIRKCCELKDFDGCWQCDEIQDCDKLEFLDPVHNDAHMKNLQKIKKVGLEKWINGKRFW